MRILVVSESSWNDKDSLGNSLNNWFEGWEDCFYHFFTRKVIPNNSFVKEYYNLSSKDIVRGFLRLNIKGISFTQEEVNDAKNIFQKDAEKEQETIKKIHSKKGQFIYFINECVWKSKFWFNRNIKSFLNRIKPEIIFALTKSGYISRPIIKYCKKQFNTKIVLFSADDVYGQYLKAKFYRRIYLINSFKWLIYNADIVYCCSPLMVDYYKKQFGIESKWLTKGCDFKEVVCKKENCNTIKIVYAGNLLYGRDDVLLSICESISKLNIESNKMVLSILTTSVGNSKLSFLETNYDFVKVKKNVDYDKVVSEMNSSDYVLIVESFDEKHLYETRYSFSTKITDAIQSGSAILAIGSASVNTISFLSKIDGVLFAHSKNELADLFDFIIHNPTIRNSNALKIRLYGQSIFDRDRIKSDLRSDFLRLLSLKN